MPALSAVDQAFFLLETPERPMSIGALLVLEPPAGARGRFAEQLIEKMLECPVGPPFNYLLRPGPFKPLLALERSDRVDARRQVHRHVLPKGSDLDSLFKRICRIHVQLLRRDEPLWQAHVFKGLPDGRVALYFKTHHGLIDGIGFIRIVTNIVSDTGEGRRPHALWEGMLAVPQIAGAAGPQAAAATGLLDTAGAMLRTANDLARLAWHQGQRVLGLGDGLAPAFVSTPNVLKTPPSANRVLAHCTVPLRRAREIARRGQAKINDVMLAAIDLALTRYLEERGTPPDRPLVADIPVALQDHGGTGNRITILQVPMGRPGSRPAERLREIVVETRQMKHEVRSLAGGSLILYSIVGHSIASTIESLRLSELPMLANVVVSNPAGLERRVHFNGAAVELALPVSVVGHHQVLNVTVTTYFDMLHVTFIALREAIPDLHRLAAFTTDAVDQLAAEVLPAPRRRAAPRKASRRRVRR